MDIRTWARDGVTSWRPERRTWDPGGTCYWKTWRSDADLYLVVNPAGLDPAIDVYNPPWGGRSPSIGTPDLSYEGTSE